VPDPFRRHFIVDAESVTVRPELRARVRFEAQNLLDPRHPRAVDLVLCRNVLIYFDAERRAQVIAQLSDALRPGGWLCLGYSESLRNNEEARLEPVRVNESALYRRREITMRIALPTFPEEEEALPATLPRLQPVAAPMVLKLRGEYHDGARLQVELRPFLHRAAVIDLDSAHFLGDDAARVLKRALQAAPTLSLRATRAPVLRWLSKHGLK
jgi:SAM-dependent methyltransferase